MKQNPFLKGLFLAIGLILLPVAARPDPNPRPNLPEILVPGKAVTRSIWEEDILFSYKGKAGETITLHVTSKTSGLDPHVALVDPEDLVEAFDDDSGGHGNSFIKNHVLKKSGRYTVNVGASQGNKGKVAVLLEKAKKRDPVSHDEPSLPESLVSGQAVTRAVWKDGVLLFFEGKAGEVVTIRVTSKTPGLDPHVELLDPEAHEEASDDDSGGQGNSRIKEHTLKKSGRYTIRVGAAKADGGKVEVLLDTAGT